MDIDLFLAEYAQKFKVLADPMRLKLLLLVRDGEKCVCELVDALNERQSLISYHLGLMVKAGLLERRKEGTWAYYRLSMEVEDWVLSCCKSVTAECVLTKRKGN
ncbi:MAG: metalloregulator ArsR/SmtB family transcription factor [Heliobacteriaceae bacterium]|nr:metalloregulator ArsR/SmtB family transcription factor [Heliobacteriaceae bacterium]